LQRLVVRVANGTKKPATTTPMTKTTTKAQARRAQQLANIATNAVLSPPPLVGALKLWQAAEYLSVSPLTVRRLIERGLIRPNRATRHVLISIRELDRFLAEGQIE
jgi:excisionase family DNA binding protein